MDRYAECFALNVEQGVYDGPYCLLVEPAGRLHRAVIEQRADPLDLHGVLPDDQIAERPDDGANPEAPGDVLAELGPTNQTRVGGNLDKRCGSPTEITVQILDAGYFHGFDCLIPFCTNLHSYATWHTQL